MSGYKIATNLPVLLDTQGRFVGFVGKNGEETLVPVFDSSGAALRKADGTLFGGGGVATITGTYAVGQTLTASYPAGTVGTIQFTRTMTTAPFTKTAISGAVANAVNSLTYVVQAGDTGFTIGVDSSNQVAYSAGGLVPAALSTIFQQAMKLRPNDLYNGGSSGLRTCWHKFEFDAPFNQVQHLIGSKVASGTPGTYKVQFAVTDTIAVDTATNAWVPVRNGVAYNDKSAFGWKDATFSGAASKQIGLAPSQGNNSAIHMSTDVMDLASIPRADGKPGGILLVKVVQTDAAGQYTQASSNSSLWDGARGSFPWFREWFCNATSNVDGITNLATLPGGAPFNGDFVFPGTPVVTNTASSVPIELLLFTGDSRKSAAYMEYRFANQSRMAAMSLSTPSRPISVVNAAGSGHSQTQYLALAMDHLTAGLRPTVIHIPGFSQNGFSTFATFKTNNDNFMAAARAIPGLENVKFVLDTDYYVTGYAVGTGPENGRQQCIAYAKSLANGVNVFCFDSDAIITDYSNPSAPTFKSTYYTGTSFIGGDGVHAGPIGINALAYGDGTTPGLQSVYRSAFGIA